MCRLPWGSACAHVPGSAGSEAELAQNSPSREKNHQPLQFFSPGVGTHAVAARWQPRGSPAGAQPTQLAAASPSGAAHLHFTLEKLQLPLPHPSRQPLTGICNPWRVSKERGSPAKGFGRRTLTVSARGKDGTKKQSKAWLSLFSSLFLSHLRPEHRARSPQKVAGRTARNPARWGDGI